MQRVAQRILADVGTVGLRGVDEVDADVAQTRERAQRLGAVLGRAPDTGTGDAHGAEAQARDGQVAADGNVP